MRYRSADNQWCLDGFPQKLSLLEAFPSSVFMRKHFFPLQLREYSNCTAVTINKRGAASMQQLHTPFQCLRDSKPFSGVASNVLCVDELKENFKTRTQSEMFCDSSAHL